MWKGHFKTLQGLLTLLPSVMKVKSSYHQVFGEYYSSHEDNMGEGTKEYLDTREPIICSKAVVPKSILTLVKPTSPQYSTNLIF